MIVNGVLVELESRPDTADELEELLDDVLRLADREPHSELNLLLRTGDRSWTLAHFFMDDLARSAHRAGAASQAIAYSRRLLAAEPRFVDLDLSVRADSLLAPWIGRRDLIIDLRPTCASLTPT